MTWTTPDTMPALATVGGAPENQVLELPRFLAYTAFSATPHFVPFDNWKPFSEWVTDRSRRRRVLGYGNNGEGKLLLIFFGPGVWHCVRCNEISRAHTGWRHARHPALSGWSYLCPHCYNTLATAFGDEPWRKFYDHDAMLDAVPKPYEHPAYWHRENLAIVLDALPS